MELPVLTVARGRNVEIAAPRNPLEKISGVVQNLRMEKGAQDLIFTKTDSQYASVVSIGLTALGQVASVGAEVARVSPILAPDCYLGQSAKWQSTSKREARGRCLWIYHK
jgi:hypothetical protein